MTQDHNTDTANDNVLPADTHMAMQALIKISNTLTGLAETETQMLVRNDMLGFSMLQNEKEELVNRYVKASSEFKDRSHEFRGLDTTLINRLDTIQKTLGERTKSNNLIVKRMNQKSEEKTMDSLLAVQELSQTVHKRFPDSDTEHEVAQK